MGDIIELGTNESPSETRSSFIHVANTRRRLGCGSSTRGQRTISNGILVLYEKAFEKFGFLLARKAIFLLLVFLTVAAASFLGFLRLRVEQHSSEDFTKSDVQSRNDLLHAAKFFPIVNARQEQIIISPKKGQDIFSEDCLKEAVLIHQTVVNISGYKTLCSRQMSLQTTTKLAEQNCVISSPLELAGANFEHLNNLSTILAREWTNPRTVLSTGQSFHSSFNEMVSNFQINTQSDPLTAQADAIRVIYFMRMPTNEEDHEVFNFETSFERKVSSINQRLNCASLSLRTGLATSNAIKNILKPDLKPLYLSALIIGLVALMVVYFTSNNLSFFTTVLLILLSVLLPLTCTAGILSSAGISLFPTTLFIPFLLLGKITSDLVIFLSEWEQQKKQKSLEHRVSSCIVRAGICQVFSAVCGTVLFGIAIKSSFEVISRFFLAAFVAYLLAAVASLIVTVSLLLSLEKQLKLLDTSCARSCGRSSSLTTTLRQAIMNQLIPKLRVIRINVSQILTSRANKVFSFFTFACIFSLSMSSAFQPGERTSTIANLDRQNDNFNQFREAQQKFFGNETDVSIVFSEEIDYSQETRQNQVVNICERLGEASYSHKESVCWMADALQWGQDHNMTCSNSEFHRCLHLFLNQSNNFPFRQDVRFKENNPRLQIIVSRIHVKMAQNKGFKEDGKSLEELRHDLSTQPSLKPAPVSDSFFELDDLFSLEREVVFDLAVATVVLFLLCLVSSSFLRISACITVTFTLLVFETAGIMKVWRIHLNHISFISLFFTIVLALNFSLQVAYSFVLSEKRELRERINTALCSLTWPVLTAVMLEICGSISLGFIYPTLQDIFFRLIPPVLVLGMIHAFVIFPPMMTLLFGLMESFDSPNEEDIEMDQKKPKKSLKVMGGDSPQRRPKLPGISIVGIGCRFPGANSKDLFWNLLEQGKSSIGAFPRNREEQHEMFLHFYHPQRFVSGRLCTVHGSYLNEIQTFDNEFFGISTQEARGMDPQQRILLEVVYEAIEDAGVKLEELQKCRTGVFVGVMNLDYGSLVTDQSNYKNIDQFSSTGITASILANRVSFCLNFTGPSIAVDTACSSSLTALKLACDSLHNGDCDIAIVCAPNIVLNFAMQMVSSMAGLLAPDGRCKSFDASGDGYGRGEGVAAVILKLSNAAVSDRDDEYCEIIACGMNNDGQNAIPMTAPSSTLQSKLTSTVLERSGVNAADVDYVEAHGTGTAIGDVIEVTSIAETYTRGNTNPTRKLRIGSVKSNLNHTESTSGLAGVIKVALMIKKKMLVPTVNVHTLNPRLKLEENGIILQQTSEPWITQDGKPRIAAVNSFGYGGSNAHVILREVITNSTFEEDRVRRLNHILTISARSQESLKRMAAHYSKWLNDAVEDMDSSFVKNFCYSMNERRSQFPHRLALSFESISEASKVLSDYADGSMGWEKMACYGEVKSSNTKIVFMFGGQGSQWYAMGRQLFESEPVFKESILTVSKLVRDLGKPWSLIDELLASEEESRIVETFLSQLATFAIQYATAQLLMSWRIYPSAVLGHSLGEFAAACTAGIITLKEAVQLVLTRSTLQDQCPNNGGMAALGMSEERARNMVVELKLSQTVEIAAINDANSVTVSGDSESIQALGQHLAIHSKDTFWRVLGTKRAFHSAHMELIKKPFQAEVRRVKLNPVISKIPMYSTVEGKIVSGEQFNGDYWWRNIRCPVQFQPAMKNVLKDGYKQIIEISTQPILAHYVKQISKQEKIQDQAIPVVLATLPRKRVPVNEQHKFFLLNTLCRLYTAGFPIDWTFVQRNPSAKFIRSLSYPWLERSFWYRDHPPRTIILPLGKDKEAKTKTHPFLETLKMTDQYSGLHCWETEIDLHRFPNLRDHALIQGGAVVPGAAYLEMAFAMVKDLFADVVGVELSDVKLLNLLTLPETQVRSLRLRIQKTKNIGEAKYDITSVQDDHSEFNLSSGRISVDLLCKQETCEREVSDDVGRTVQKRIANMKKVPMIQFRELTKRFGFNYGPTFSIIKKAWECDNEGLCLVDISELLNLEGKPGNYVVHPSILDACLQCCFIPLANSLTGEKSIVPVAFKTVTLNDLPLTKHMYCHVVQDVKESGRFNVTLMSPSGSVLLNMNDFRAADVTNLSRQLSFAQLRYEVQWKEDELAEKSQISSHLTCLVLEDSSSLSNSLVTRLQALQVNVITVHPPNGSCFNKEAEDTIQATLADMPPHNLRNVRIINLWPLEASFLPAKFEVIDQAQGLAFKSSAFLIRVLLDKDLIDSRLFLVTERTQLLQDCGKSLKRDFIPWGSTVWGLRRTAHVEDLNVRVTAVDLCDKEDQQEVDSLVKEILGDSVEDEVVFQGRKRFINRLLRSKVQKERSTIAFNKDHKKKRSLYLSTIPSSRTLCLREQSFPRPLHTEVAIDVQYCWNPSQSLFELSRPDGCVFVSGKVIHLPEKNAHTFQIGDEVCGVIPSGRVSRSIMIKGNNTFLKPVNLSTEQATYIPACLALASYSLQRATSGTEKGNLLIHQANRGPGPAAVLLAKTLGHRVTCTISNACTSSTETLLLNLGADSVTRQCSCQDNSDSVDQFDAVIFFSPPRPNALNQSGHSLKKRGRVIILSSQFEGDIVISASKTVEYVRNDISDILQPPLAFEKLTMQSLEILESKGLLAQLLGIPMESVNLETSIKAANGSTDEELRRKPEEKKSADISFSVLSLATFEESHQDIPLFPQGLDECGLKENRTYLVAGGLRGFGFEVACWMAENGAKTIGILSRSKPSESKRRELQHIQKKSGAKLHAIQVDISSQGQMSSFKEQLRTLPSVAGIVNSAMVLRDEFLKNLTFEAFTEVMGPKIKGSYLLHQMSLEMDLDFFVMFSSMSSVVGNMGQSSYAACNAFEDSLAQYRRHVLGLPGLAINWGPISGAGVLAREIAVAKLLSKGGLGFINAKEGVKHMAKVLTEEPGRCQISLFNADWPEFLKHNTRLRKSPRLSIIADEINTSDSQTSSAESLAQRIILEKDGEKRAELVKEYVSLSVTEWTGISSPSETDLTKSLYSYGTDSAKALTLKVELETNLQVSFEIFYFMQPETTPLKLARDISHKLSGQSRHSQPSSEQPQDSDSQETDTAQTKPITDTPLEAAAATGSEIQVVPLYTPEGSAIKFFCVHPSHPYAMNLVPISTGFQGQDLVSFYALGFTDPAALSEDWGGVRELATHYVKLISEEQSHGPYFLGGYSYGGMLAYEMASLLTEQKQSVAFVAMIDTFPWWPLSRTISARLIPLQEIEKSHSRHVEHQFENYMRKLAIDSLEISDDEYQRLREEHNQDWIIDELQRRSLEKGISAINLTALRESLTRNQTLATRTHYEWQPSEVRYRGPLTYLKCQNTRFSARLRPTDSVEEEWGQLVDGGTTTLVCPGDHYSMSALPHAHVTGSTLATALAFSYRQLFPEFPRPPRTFSQRRAVEKLYNGVNVFLHSKRGNKRPHFGQLHFMEDAYQLELRSQDDEGETKENKKTKKIIDLKELRMVQPGRFVSSALKHCGRKRRVGADHSGNLGQIASVITNRRVYNLEFTDYSDLKAFYSMIEAVFGLTLLST